MLKIAMLGKWHVHAEGYAKEFNSQSDSAVTCVWDSDPERGASWAKSLGVPFFADIDELFENAEFDATCVCSETNRHKDLMLKAAEKQKHIFTEKVMCLKESDCGEVVQAIERNGITFTISLPHRGFAHNLYIKNAIDEGILGQVTLLRVRNCHDGALRGWLPDYWYDPITTGGGAMMDLGAHPMYLCAWMLGEPTEVSSSFRHVNGRQVEDDAISVLSFKNGARALVETSLVAPHNPQICEVYGTKGAIICENGKLRLKTNATDGWTEPALPEALPSPIRQFTDSVLYKKPVRYGTNDAKLLTLMMQKAYEADKLGKTVKIMD